jgi:hypothetical protein
MTATAVISTNMAGKGSRRRLTKVPAQVVDANYEAIFGKYVPLYLRKKIPDEPAVKEESKEKPKDKE